MAAEPIIVNTLRKLMQPRVVLRTNFCVMHDHAAQMSNFTLEMSQSPEEGLSVIEMCAEGEFISGRRLLVSEPAFDLDERVIARAMAALWEGRDEAESSGIVSVRATSILTATPGSKPCQVVQGWHYRQLEQSGTMEIWAETQKPVTGCIAKPQATSMRACLIELQLAATRLQGEFLLQIKANDIKRGKLVAA